ncbi:Kelch domain-containing protein 3 [Linum perenne]
MRWERLQRQHHNAAGAGGGVAVPPLDGLDGPGKRWGHTCNSVRGGRFLYVFGGYGRDNCHTNQVHVFDTVTHTWSQPALKGTPPIPRDSHTCTTIGEHFYVFGGTDGVKPLRDLHILNTSTHTWISPTMRGDGPEAREGHSAAVVGKRIYIFGGCGQSSDTNNEVYYNDLYILNTETLVWKELSTMGQKLPPRAGHSTVAFGKNLFVFGGFADSQNLYNDLYMLDIESGMWTKVMAIGDGPCARFSAACDSLDPLKGGVLVFIGGCDKHLEALDDMYYLHTGLTSIQDNWRAENLSWRKQLKLKCQEQSFNSDNSNRVDPTASFHGSMPTYGRHGPETVHFNVLQVHQGKKTFQATVAETFPYGYTIETIIDGKPLRGLLFSNRPTSPPVVYNDSRKRLSDEIGGVVSNGDYTSRAKASRTSSKDEIDRPQVVGSHENESVMQDLKAEGSVAANVKSIASSDASQLQESGANLEAAATLNLNDDMKIDGPNSAIDIPKEIATPTALSLNQGVNLIAMIFST